MVSIDHLEIIPHDKRQLPDARIGLGGARRDHAVVENLKKEKTLKIVNTQASSDPCKVFLSSVIKYCRYLVVESVGEAGRLVLVDGHGAVVGEVSVIHHRVHVVASNGEERSSHSPGNSGQILASEVAQVEKI